mmetsp:Transcript_17674/g.52578  ORF Transcript_17674/g.52578 Transcript_17674/m.52578 type:complete len:112 (-) Transcript_17674:123-458(-)
MDAKRRKLNEPKALQKNLVEMLYGFGDAEEPDAESVELVATLVARYVEALCGDAQAVARLRSSHLSTGCFLCAVKADKNKYFKVRGLLEAKESIKEARKVDRGVADSEEDE